MPDGVRRFAGGRLAAGRGTGIPASASGDSGVWYSPLGMWPLQSRGWEKRLYKQFEQFPQALIGESGLDGFERKTCVAAAAFERQIEAASVLKRPLVVHAVKAVAQLQDFLVPYARLFYDTFF